MTGLDKVRALMEEAGGAPVSTQAIARKLWPDGQRPLFWGEYVRTCMQRLRARGFYIQHHDGQGYSLSKTHPARPFAERVRAAIAHLRSNAARAAL